MSETQALVRRPISVKIFGIALVLLALMIVVTISSSLNLRRLGQQLNLLSDYFIELDQQMGDLRTQTLREVIQIERVLASYDLPGLYALMVNGHTHRRMVRPLFGGTFAIVNAGTLARQKQPCFASIDFSTNEIHFYDLAPATYEITRTETCSLTARPITTES